MKKIILLTAATVAFSLSMSHAQETATDSIFSSVNIGEVIITATGMPRKLKDSPVPIRLITAQELSQGNIFTLEDALLKLSPSITTFTNGMGTTVSYNGLNDDYFIFLLNGKRMDGNNAMARIDFSNVVRIEMLSGASSVLYGTNAIGGVINIITRNAASDDSVNASAKTQLSSHGRYRSAASVGIKAGRLHSTTSYNRNESDGWQLNEYEEETDDEAGDILVKTDKVASTGFTNHTFTQGFNYLANDRLTLDAGGSFYQNETDRPQSIYRYNLHHQSYNYNVGGSYQLNDRGDRIELDYHSDNYKSSYSYFKDDARAKAEKGDLVMRKLTHYHNVNAKSLFHLGETGTLYSGLEYMYNTLESVAEKLEGKNAYTMALFSQYEIKFWDNFSAMGGFRYTYHETFNSHATYHASLRYGIGGFNARASYSTGFRTPTLSELYAEKVTVSFDRLSLPNINLQPEKSNYLSLNAEYRNRWLAVTATAFQNKLRDMIVFRPFLSGEEAEAQYGYSEVIRRENTARARVRGVNASLTLTPGAGFAIGGGYTFLDTKDEETDRPIDKSIRNVYTVNASWGHRWGKYKLSIAANGRISDERYSVTYGYAPKYQLWDLTTTHSFDFKELIVEPSIGIENLFNHVDDRPFNSNYATLSPGRTIFASLAIRFN